MDSTRIDTILAEAARSGAVPGVVAMATTADGPVYAGAAGRRALPDGAPMDTGTVFWIASMTKALTSVAALQLVEQGRLALDAPIGSVVPALAAPQILERVDADGRPHLRPATRPVTLRQLLTHTSGYGYDTWSAPLGPALRHLGVTRVPRSADEVARTPILFEPGTGWSYGISTDLVGLAVEAASGMRLDAWLRAQVFEPLGMRDTTFQLTDAQRQRLARVHARGPDGTLSPIDWPVGVTPAFCMGGGGLCSTAGDYLRFLRMMLGRGSLDGVRILAPETVAQMGRNQIGTLTMPVMKSAVPASSQNIEFFPGMAKQWGLGFMINAEPVEGRRSAGSLAWAGLGNCYYWIDPSRGVAGLILTQILPFGDPHALALLERFERAVYAGFA